jgi:serine/threonine-protein kinase RsbW
VSSSDVEVIQITIPSRLELLPLVDQLTAGISERMAFDEESRVQISISVLEAGTNAIQHGNQVDPTKLVNMSFNLHPDHLEVVVKDKGHGFDLAKLTADITTPDHLFDLRGRGIYMMRECMDKVDFTFDPDGTTCRLVKARKPTATNGSMSAA